MHVQNGISPTIYRTVLNSNFFKYAKFITMYINKFICNDTFLIIYVNTLDISLFIILGKS